MKLRDRMTIGNPLLKRLVDRIDPLIDRENLTRAGITNGLFALIGNIATKYEAHRVLTTGSVHAGADNVNSLITSATPTTKAALVSMINDIYTKFNAHIIRTTSCHGAADTTNTLIRLASESMDYEELQEIVNDIRAKYEAHRVLTAGGVHGAADNTNSVTVSANTTTFVRSLNYEE